MMLPTTTLNSGVTIARISFADPHLAPQPTSVNPRKASRKTASPVKNATKLKEDKQENFHLRKKEDLKKKYTDGELIEIDLDENQATIHAVKTEAHLHIPMNSGNVIKIPLSQLKEPSHHINISKELNNSGMWKHIQQTDSKNSLNKMAPKSDKDDHIPHLAQPEEDEDAIMIKVIRPSPHGSTQNIAQDEQKPLLTKRDGKSGSPTDSP